MHLPLPPDVGRCTIDLLSLLSLPFLSVKPPFPSVLAARASLSEEAVFDYAFGVDVLSGRARPDHLHVVRYLVASGAREINDLVYFGLKLNGPCSKGEEEGEENEKNH